MMTDPAGEALEQTKTKEGMPNVSEWFYTRHLGLPLAFDDKELELLRSEGNAITVDLEANDDYVRVDAVPWFEQAGDDEIYELGRRGFVLESRTAISQPVVAFLANTEPEVANAIAKASKANNSVGGRINAADALLWLRDQRPVLFDRIRHDAEEEHNLCRRLGVWRSDFVTWNRFVGDLRPDEVVAKFNVGDFFLIPRYAWGQHLPDYTEALREYGGDGKTGLALLYAADPNRHEMEVDGGQYLAGLNDDELVDLARHNFEGEDVTEEVIRLARQQNASKLEAIAKDAEEVGFALRGQFAPGWALAWLKKQRPELFKKIMAAAKADSLKPLQP